MILLQYITTVNSSMLVPNSFTYKMASTAQTADNTLRWKKEVMKDNCHSTSV